MQYGCIHNAVFFCRQVVLMRLNSTWIKGLCAVGALWLALLSVGFAEVEIRPTQTTDAATGALAQRVRDELSRSSLRVASLDARIVIGADAFQEALAQDDGRALIAAYLTSTEFEAALGGRQRSPHITAVFSNPDPRDQVALARALLGRSTLGVFDSPATRSLVARVSDRGAHAIPVAPGQDIDSLLRAASPFDVLIALPDSAVLNRANINHVVRALYERRKVLIGYSATLTQVGSLASVNVSPEAIARGVKTVLERYAASGVLPDPLFVRDVDVSVNDRLARSLNIALPDRAELSKVVRSQRTGPETTP